MLQQDTILNPPPLSFSLTEAGRLAGAIQPVAELRPDERRQMYGPLF
jgi:hypothetical protein